MSLRHFIVDCSEMFSAFPFQCPLYSQARRPLPPETESKVFLTLSLRKGVREYPFRFLLIPLLPGVLNNIAILQGPLRRRFAAILYSFLASVELIFRESARRPVPRRSPGVALGSVEARGPCYKSFWDGVGNFQCKTSGNRVLSTSTEG